MRKFCRDSQGWVTLAGAGLPKKLPGQNEVKFHAFSQLVVRLWGSKPTTQRPLVIGVGLQPHALGNRWGRDRAWIVRGRYVAGERCHRIRSGPPTISADLINIICLLTELDQRSRLKMG
ncbi:MAG TPA: hypothetical protein VMW80_00770 [Candidatus Dormibacteraeota bacterium]|nr:hypothetical protein [Candidatus Dormibacteraeota bacterium]